jgi:hypothetical protein
MIAPLREASGNDALRANPAATIRETLPPGSQERASRDPRAIEILAKSIYRELRQSGQQDQDVMRLASELLSLLASDVKDRRRNVEVTSTPPAPRAAR